MWTTLAVDLPQSCVAKADETLRDTCFNHCLLYNLHFDREVGGGDASIAPIGATALCFVSTARGSSYLSFLCGINWDACKTILPSDHQKFGPTASMMS